VVDQEAAMAWTYPYRSDPWLWCRDFRDLGRWCADELTDKTKKNEYDPHARNHPRLKRAVATTLFREHGTGENHEEIWWIGWLLYAGHGGHRRYVFQGTLAAPPYGPVSFTLSAPAAGGGWLGMSGPDIAPAFGEDVPLGPAKQQADGKDPKRFAALFATFPDLGGGDFRWSVALTPDYLTEEPRP
jgi:hypothetical protein